MAATTPHRAAAARVPPTFWVGGPPPRTKIDRRAAADTMKSAQRSKRSNTQESRVKTLNKESPEEGQRTSSFQATDSRVNSRQITCMDVQVHSSAIEWPLLNQCYINVQLQFQLLLHMTRSLSFHVLSPLTAL